MIVITGAAGFIGSCLVARLNAEGYTDLVLVDDFSHPEKDKNLEGKKFTAQVHRNAFIQWLDQNQEWVQFIFHLGARTDTTEFNKDLLDELNLNYTKAVWNACVKYSLPLLYASSAATYGLGELGYKDEHALSAKLKPLNPYGVSKNDFDIWALEQEKKPFFWIGIKFFNVYGPNEFHKARMASVVYHTHKQVTETGKMKLFRSHNTQYKDGEQLRDFIYVKDAVDVLYFFMHHRKNPGIYNLGTGQARSFYDLATATFSAMGKKPEISFIDMPEDIRDKYQYYTQADMSKLRSIGYTKPFTSLEDGITEYVQQYLLAKKCY